VKATGFLRYYIIEEAVATSGKQKISQAIDDTYSDGLECVLAQTIITEHTGVE